MKWCGMRGDYRRDIFLSDESGRFPASAQNGFAEVS